MQFYALLFSQGMSQTIQLQKFIIAKSSLVVRNQACGIYGGHKEEQKERTFLCCGYCVCVLVCVLYVINCI